MIDKGYFAKLDRYCKKGWFIFPISAKTKIPIIKDMLNQASNDPKVVLQWAKEHVGCNWGVSLHKSGMVCVDVDNRHGGLEAWQNMRGTWPKFKTLTQESASGGFHYFFKEGKGVQYKGKIRRGIDIKHKGYVVLEPSQNSSGDGYRFKNWGHEVEEVPNFIAEVIEKRKIEKQDDAFRIVPKLGETTLEKLVTEIQKKELDYETWVKVGMAIHSTMPNQHGLDLFLNATNNKGYKDGDFEKAEYKWQSFSEAEGEEIVTSKSLFYIVKSLGGKLPKLTNAERSILREEFEGKVQEDMATKTGWFKEYNRQVSYHADFIIRQIHEMGYYYYKGGGNAAFARLRTGPKGEKSVQTMSKDAFITELAPYFLKSFKKMENGNYKPVYEPASKFWIENVSRRTVDEIIFEPFDKAGALNLWCGIPCVAREPDKRLKEDLEDFINEFMLNSLCGGSEDHLRFILDWAAHIAQRPDEKSTVVPVILGKQGTGKGLFTDGLMAKILGPLCAKIYTGTVLKEKFNKEQSCKLLTNIDEATFRGDHQLDGILKGLTGSDTMTIEEKFGARYKIKNYSRYIITSNSMSAINIERSNRRYYIINCSEKHLGDSTYFDRFWTMVKTPSFIEAFYWYFLNRDISDFKPFELPKNLSGFDTKLEGAGTIGKYWHDRLVENPEGMFVNGDFLPKEATYKDFLRYSKEVGTFERNLSRQKFWSETKDMLKINGQYDARLTLSNGQKPRGLKILPSKFVYKFCDGLNIERPKDFDDLELYIAQKEFEDKTFF